GGGGVGGDRLDRHRDARGVGEAEVALGRHWLGGDDLDLARSPGGVEVERLAIRKLHLASAARIVAHDPAPLGAFGVCPRMLVGHGGGVDKPLSASKWPKTQKSVRERQRRTSPR